MATTSIRAMPPVQLYPQNVQSAKKVTLNFTPLTDTSITISLPQHEVNIRVDEHNVSSCDKRKEVCVHQVEMLNARHMNCSLDTEGFQLIDHLYNHINYYDDNEVVQRYYPELETCIKQRIPQAHKVFVFHHQVRSWRKDVFDGGSDKPNFSSVNSIGPTAIGLEAKSQLLPPQAKDPVQFCHSDFSLVGAVNRLKAMGPAPLPTSLPTTATLPPPGPLRHVLTAEEVQYYLHPEQSQQSLRPSSASSSSTSRSSRFMILHAWRNICKERPLTTQDYPLALCCAHSVRDEDLLAYDLTYWAEPPQQQQPQQEQSMSEMKTHNGNTGADTYTGSSSSSSSSSGGISAQPTGRLSCLMVRYHPQQQWASFPAMRHDELLLFKQFDSSSTFARKHWLRQNSDDHGYSDDHSCACECERGREEDYVACFVPHLAFGPLPPPPLGASDDSVDAVGPTDHPTLPCSLQAPTAGDGRGRESIEAGVLVLFE